MKITIDVDCTPAEARAFLGLPDVQPMQENLLAEMEKRMQANLAAMDADQMLKTWLPAGMKGLEELQKMFWAQAVKPSGSGKKG